MTTGVKSNSFYVYEHRTQDTGRLFYIGKGKGDRATAKNGRNKYWKNVVAKHGYTVRFIEKDMSESDAFDLEVAAIDFCKWAGCRLANLTNGGDGSSGLLWNEDRRLKIQQSHGSKEFKQAISEQSKAKWADPEFHAKTSYAIKEAHSTPEALMAASKRSITNWNNPSYVEKICKANKEAWNNAERKKAASEIMSKTWQNEEIRNKRIDGIKSRLNTEEARKKTASSMHTPEAKANNRAALEKAFKRPEVIAKRAASMAAWRERRNQWAKDNKYIGHINKITLKMMEADRGC
jgi:hypothetical protein